jgi:hypothetical protein
MQTDPFNPTARQTFSTMKRRATALSNGDNLGLRAAPSGRRREIKAMRHRGEVRRGASRAALELVKIRLKTQGGAKVDQRAAE